jgi:hypothetical protein
LPGPFTRKLHENAVARSRFSGALRNFQLEVVPCCEQFGDALCRRSPSFRPRSSLLFPGVRKRRDCAANLRKDATGDFSSVQFLSQVIEFINLSWSAAFKRKCRLRKPNVEDGRSWQFRSYKNKNNTLCSSSDSAQRAVLKDPGAGGVFSHNVTVS